VEAAPPCPSDIVDEMIECSESPISVFSRAVDGSRAACCRYVLVLCLSSLYPCFRPEGCDRFANRLAPDVASFGSCIQFGVVIISVAWLHHDFLLFLHQPNCVHLGSRSPIHEQSRRP
jgi:hypothetical protein